MIRLALFLLLMINVADAEVKVYSHDDLQSMAGKPVSDGSCLVGTFIFLRQVTDDMAVFVAFEDGLLGKEMVTIRFHANEPQKLSEGKLVRVTTDEPLVLREVTQSGEGIVMAFAEYFGTP